MCQSWHFWLIDLQFHAIPTCGGIYIKSILNRLQLREYNISFILKINGWVLDDGKWKRAVKQDLLSESIRKLFYFKI